MRALAAAILAVSLAGCVNIKNEKGGFCESYAPIATAAGDSPQTIAQVKRANDKYEAVCGEKAGAPKAEKK